MPSSRAAAEGGDPGPAAEPAGGRGGGRGGGTRGQRPPQPPGAGAGLSKILVLFSSRQGIEQNTYFDHSEAIGGGDPGPAAEPAGGRGGGPGAIGRHAAAVR
nr:unnamed protein product [uncultured bacterium]